MKRVLVRLRFLAGLGLVVFTMGLAGCTYYPHHGSGHIGYHDGHFGYGGGTFAIGTIIPIAMVNVIAIMVFTALTVGKDRTI